MTGTIRALVVALGVTGMIWAMPGAAAPDYSSDVARAMQSGDYAQARNSLRKRANWAGSPTAC